jgi:BirA family transcriptional regulator, biotin operon repressor / biotin---[acetyl-CoA-carboxylase] ligase
LKSSLPDNLRAACETPADVREELRRRASRLGPFGRRLHWLSTASSTNDVAAGLAEVGAEEGTTVVAETQTAGRGRMGREWFSPPGAGLYVSVVLRPPSPGFGAPGVLAGERPREPAALLTLMAGVALAEGVRAGTGLPVELKWPNDLRVGKRKLAGILAEAAASGGDLHFVVLGFGLNLRTAAYPPELAVRTTSIEAELNRPVDRAVILSEILSALAARCADLRQGRFDAILGAWRQHATSLRGSLVEWDTPQGVRRGRAEDVDMDGALLVRADGAVERLIAGEVRWV